MRQAKLGKSIEAMDQWLKKMRYRMKLKTILEKVGWKLRGPYNYCVTFNEAKLGHFYFVTIGAVFRWINRRSQKRSYNWERFKQRLVHQPLPRPPRGYERLDITSEHGALSKPTLKSRMPKLGTYGSVRSAFRQRRAFI